MVSSLHGQTGAVVVSQHTGKLRSRASRRGKTKQAKPPRVGEPDGALGCLTFAIADGSTRELRPACSGCTGWVRPGTQVIGLRNLRFFVPQHDGTPAV
jgi:hypothetical protein